MTNKNYIDYQNQSFKNREKIKDSESCSCFYCLESFKSKKITEWTDDDQTAICPHCGVDAVIPKNEDLTKEILKDLKEIWFSSAFSVVSNEDNETSKSVKNVTDK